MLSLGLCSTLLLAAFFLMMMQVVIMTMAMTRRETLTAIPINRPIFCGSRGQ